MAEEMTRAVADVLQRDGDAQRLKRELRDYLRELKPRRLEPGAVRRQVAGLLDDLELHAVVGRRHGPLIDVESVVADLRSRGTLGARGRRGRRPGPLRRAAASPARRPPTRPRGPSRRPSTPRPAVPADRGDRPRPAAAGSRNTSGGTDRAELNPEGIKRDLAGLFAEPRAGAADAPGPRGDDRPRDGPVAAGGPRRRRRRARPTASSRRGRGGGRLGRRPGRRRPRTRSTAARPRPRAASRPSDAGPSGSCAATSTRSTSRSWITTTSRRTSPCSSTTPKAGAEALRDRWQAMDRDTLRAVIASARSDLDEDDAEALLGQLESVRDEALAQADKLKSKARRELRKARREALEQAEEVRKVASEAAWWAFGTAAVSGAAAVVGGVLGASRTVRRRRRPATRSQRYGRRRPGRRSARSRSRAVGGRTSTHAPGAAISGRLGRR